eukprot:525461_1
MLALWLMFTVRLITAALLDCGYIADPTVTIKGEDIKHHAAIPLNVCSSVYSASIGENAFKLSCDESEVIIDVWSGTECDGNPINGAHTVKTVDNPNLEPFNCVSKNECDYVYTKFIFYNPPTNCKNPQDIDSQIKAAIITDICIPTHSGGSEIYTSCDLSGTATQLEYNMPTNDCTGTENRKSEFPSDGNCVANGQVWVQAICHTTDNPTTNNPTTNNPTTNTPTTNTPTTNTPTTNTPT